MHKFNIILFFSSYDLNNELFCTTIKGLIFWTMRACVRAHARIVHCLFIPKIETLNLQIKKKGLIIHILQRLCNMPKTSPSFEFFLDLFSIARKTQSLLGGTLPRTVIFKEIRVSTLIFH